LKNLKIFTGTSNAALGQSVANNLDIPLSKAIVNQFSDGEINVAIKENVRGSDCFIVQPTCNPSNKSMMELLILIEALRRSSARRITAVIPYYGYARQDRQNSARVPITAKLVANLIQAAGANRVLTVDIHSLQIAGFFDIPVDNLYAKPVFVDFISRKFKDTKNLTVVSPDAGGTARARAYAKVLNTPLAIIDKRREKANESQVMHIIGEVKNKHCLVVDDMIDTGGTLCKGVTALSAHGALSVTAAITHPVLSGDAYNNINSCAALTELITTDTIPLTNSSSKIEVVSVAPLLAEAIRRTNNEESISSLFEWKKF